MRVSQIHEPPYHVDFIAHHSIESIKPGQYNKGFAKTKRKLGVKYGFDLPI
jgi:hypothetical protein